MAFYSAIMKNGIIKENRWNYKSLWLNEISLIQKNGSEFSYMWNHNLKQDIKIKGISKHKKG